jgi:DNA primase
VALLPDGEDPDTFARTSGVEGVRALLASARPLSQHLLGTVLPEGAAAGFEQKMAALGRLRPVLAQLPVGLVRSAFFAAMARVFGLPALELESALRGQKDTVRPVSRPVAAAPAAPARPVDPVEAALVAAALQEPRLLAQDVLRVTDELVHPGLRSIVARLQAGVLPAEAVDEVAPRVLDLVAAQGRVLPTDAGVLAETFTRLCQRLKLRRIDEALSHIARVTGQRVGAHELDEETRRLQAERVELLGLRRRVLEEGRTPAARFESV